MGRKLVHIGAGYLIALCFVIECRSMWTFMPGISKWFSTSIFLLLSMAVALSIGTQGRVARRTLINGLLIFTVLALYMITYILFRRYGFTSYLKFAGAVVMLFLYYYICDRQKDESKVLIYYENIITCIAVISILFWIFGTLLGWIPASGVVESTWTGTGRVKTVPSYYGIYYYTQITNLPILGEVKRNSAIFTEAPMASFHFSMAYLIEIFLKRESSKKKKWLFALAIVSTFAMTGCIFIVIVEVGRYLISNPESRVIHCIRMIIVPLLLVICAISIYYLVQDKLSSRSGMIRIDDFVVGFMAWKKNILFGCGFENHKYIESFMGAWRKRNMGFSNSIMRILACGGIYIGILYALPIYRGISFCIRKMDKNKMLFIGAFLFLFLFTFVPYQYIVVYLFIIIAFGRN